jgi:hypothetical protein
VPTSSSRIGVICSMGVSLNSIIHNLLPGPRDLALIEPMPAFPCFQ